MYVLPTDGCPPTGVCTGDSAVHADLIRGFPASAVQRTHGGTLPPLTPPYHIVAPPHTHVQAFGVFGLCQIHAFVDFLRSKLSKEQFDFLFKTMAILVVVVVAIVGGTLTFLGSILITMTTSVFSLTPSPQRLA